MPAREPAHKRTIVQGSTMEVSAAKDRDPVVRSLTYGIFFVIVCVLSVVLYALLADVVNPPAPRTLAESTAFTKGELVKKRPNDGHAWADYAEALYARGDKSGAWAALAEGRKKVEKDKNRTIRELNVAEVDLLIKDGKNKEAVDKSTKYIQYDIDIRTQESDRNFERLIVVPYMMQDNEPTVNIFALRAKAQGNLKQWKDSIVSYDNALKLDPQAADITIMRGWAKLYGGDKAGAKKDFETALQFLPKDPSATAGLKQLQAKSK